MRLGSTARLLLLALWCGLVLGIAEVLLVQVALRGGLAVRLSADYVWMAAVVDVALALGLTLTLIAIARARGGPAPTGAVVGTLAALGVVTVAFYLESIHKAAVLLLAVGAGSQVARLAGARWARRAFVIVVPTALLMAGWLGYNAWKIRAAMERERGGAIAARPAARPGAPNVLLLILDTVRRRVSGHPDSSPTTTPIVDRWAERGVSFDLAIAPAPWTLPSHASFFTGRLPFELSASLSTPLDTRYPTLAEHLASHGYFTAGFVANLSFATRASGLGRGFIEYHDYPVSAGQMLMSSSIGRALAGTGWIRRVIGWHELPNRRHAPAVSRDFLAWLDQKRDRPYFAFLNYFDAHEPYFPRSRSGSMLWPGAKWTRFEHVVGLEAGANAEVAEKWTLTPAEVAVHDSAYLEAAARADAEAGRLLEELERRGTLTNTIVVVVGDHGEQTGQRGRFGHLNGLYLPTLHVPLVVMGPGVPNGARIAAAVSLRDLPATIVGLTGVAGNAPFPGSSLARHWSGSSHSDTVFAMLQGGYARQARYPIGHGKEMFSLTTTTHHYIRNADGTEELYRVDDPTGNLSTDSTYATSRATMSAALDALLRSRPQ